MITSIFLSDKSSYDKEDKNYLPLCKKCHYGYPLYRKGDPAYEVSCPYCGAKRDEKVNNTPVTSISLKSCPFCSGKAEITFEKQEYTKPASQQRGYYYQIECEECGVTMNGDYEKEIEAKWNLRSK